MVAKKNIFDWNHISDKLSTDEVDELKSYYLSYHRKCWAFKRAYKRFKLFKFIGNSLSVLTALGGIASAIATGGISLIAISTVALLVKGYMEHKGLDLKIQNCTYAYQSYQHLLIMIREAMRSMISHNYIGSLYFQRVVMMSTNPSLLFITNLTGL